MIETLVILLLNLAGAVMIARTPKCPDCGSRVWHTRRDVRFDYPDTGWSVEVRGLRVCLRCEFWEAA